jgi:IS30 family transposase
MTALGKYYFGGNEMNHYITEAERYKIEILLQEHYSIQEIADSLGHKYYTIYHEIKRGTVKQLDSLLKEHYVYKADYAHMLYKRNTSNRGRNLKIGSDYELVNYIEDMVKKHYSPEALLSHAEHEGVSFSTKLCAKTIYNYFDMGLFLNVTFEDLPHKKAKRKKKDNKSTVSLNNRNGRSIEERPKNILNRKSYGHWEMDTVVSGQGKGKSCLLVLSERMTREEIIIKIRDKKSSSVVHALDRLEKQLGKKKFREKFKTITCDNGVEFLDSKGIEKGKRTEVYYCHPYSSYERGTNENINRMIRRFFPKGTNFDDVSPKQVAMVQDWINNYPRKIFGGLSSRQYIDSLHISVA